MGTQKRRQESDDNEVDCQLKSDDEVDCQLKNDESSVKSSAIFILENASLQKGFVRKALLGILDSPLNKAGMVGAVYVKTDSGIVFEVKPHTRIPRTCKRFCGIMVELLEKSCVRAKDSGDVLIQVLKEPLMRHIPDNAKIIGLSYSSEKLVYIEDYVSAARDDTDLVFVIGTMVQGKVRKDSTNDYISVSRYRLSAKCCVGLVCEALEQKWKLAQG